MLRYETKYKEVIFGVLFGVGASLIDAAMHATMGDGDIMSELIHPTPVMAAYRILFLAFGVGLGVVLWLRNQSERAFRQVSASFEALRRDVTAPAVLIHANLQVLLMQYEDRISDDASAMIRETYEYSGAMHRVLTDTRMN